MKIVLEYDESTGLLTDANGTTCYMLNAKGVEPSIAKADIIEVLKQGVSPDDLVKMRNGGLV